MTSHGSLFSQTLQEITSTKLSELSKKRERFEYHHQRCIALSQRHEDLTGTLVAISDIIKQHFGITTDGGQVAYGSTEDSKLGIDLRNLDRFLAQAKYDPTVSSKLLRRWQKTLLRYMDVQSLKYTYAWLYGQLTTEWLSSTGLSSSGVAKDDEEMADFEHVSGSKKLESRARWEQSVFQETDVDPAAIRNMLHKVFEASAPDSPKVVPKATEKLREKVRAFESKFASSENFSVRTLRLAIKGLLASDLLPNEKQAALSDFDKNEAVLSEVADVLNMRLAAFQEWSWGEEVLLEERRQLNGTYNIYMQEDLLQALFLQHIGVKWSVFFKNAFRQFRKTKLVWKSPGQEIGYSERKERSHFLGQSSKYPTIMSIKKKRYAKDYFLSQLLDSENQEIEGAEGEEEADFKEFAQPTQQLGRARQTARASRPSGRFLRDESAEEEDESMGYGLFDGSSDDDEESNEDDIDDEDETRTSRNTMAARQGLLHLLSTDVLIQTRVKGDITCFRSQIDNLYPSLPHQTIMTVLGFFGVSQRWLQLFTRFLEAPLRFQDEAPGHTRLRKTGTPGSHVLSEVFAEVVLFCLDFIINQNADGEILWRHNDDFWFWSASEEKCVRAWTAINDFLRTVGLDFDETRSGAAHMQQDRGKQSLVIKKAPLHEKLPQGQIRWGMLYLNSESGRFEIDQKMVDTHIGELRRQLADKGDSIFAWVQVWNSYASTFFTSNFGKPAQCFGRVHVNNMLGTHQRIQQKVFGTESPADGNFMDVLRAKIEERHGVTDIPDGYFYLPTELGGLEIQSPFISLLQVRDAVVEDHESLFKEWEESTMAAYRRAKRNFEDGRTGKDHRLPGEMQSFFSFEDFTKYPEQLNQGATHNLTNVYLKLLEQPSELPIERDDNGEVERALGELFDRRVDIRTKLTDWHLMQPYWKWIAEMYGPELIERFGGFHIVDAGLLPMGMVGLVRSGRVRW
ncbi:hypothetical protein KC363_g3534 [Hortaea werneckii]|uniref:Reverse transcriptase domain-containing protein n=1 Tax=Hortaea werneckii TaxID=91943 RepID=A0A3M7G6I5_HORWE|nr:hypothetical protein KC325_g4139 [Hortaea werneckii]KAI6994043.1 hypothetical protein KC359_g4819 [Hortaea werneckii]KAI7145846.1 hypothetical protein KC344_g4146 [Hortaea werneckii]KAI7174728.1 hypothetical protein KC360_g4115 [Hortaea werneckii]KAI7192007.1 hypothetical protein KC363_g3534 [Hortaea werneckii]